MGRKQQPAQQQVASQLQGVYSGYGQGAKMGALTAPFMIVPPLAGEAAAGLSGSGSVENLFSTLNVTPGTTPTGTPNGLSQAFTISGGNIQVH